jgi:hypothetical protein
MRHFQAQIFLHSKCKAILNLSSKLARPVTFLICIWEVPGSNLGLHTDYPDRRYFLFSSGPPEKFRNSNLASFRILSKFIIQYQQKRHAVA